MYHIFVNPASRSGSGASLWEEAKKILDSKNIAYDVHFTEKETSIESQYKSILESDSERPLKLIILGGDGTLNQCIEGITDINNTEISLIRNGSGNDFSRNKKLPADLEGIINGILERKHEMPVDVGFAAFTEGTLPDGTPVPDGRHRFLVSSGFGYDADICFYANKSKLKKLLGKLIYVFYGVKNLFTTELVDIELSIDGGKKQSFKKVYFVACMNQPVEGGGVPMVPSAADDDGKLGFCIINSLSRFNALLTIPAIYKMKHVSKKGVSILEGRSINISSSNPKMVHYDGETPGMYKHFSAEIIGNIKFIY